MNSVGLKTVTTHGTPVQLSATTIKCTKFSIQAVRALGASGTPPTANTGAVYLMLGNVPKGAAGTSMINFLLTGQNEFTLRASSPAGLNLSDYYLDVDTDGDGALVSYE